MAPKDLPPKDLTPKDLKRSRLLVYRVFAQTIDNSARIVLDSLLGRASIKRTDRILERWSRQIFDSGRTSIDIRGLEHLTAGQSYVLMSNHQSLLDVPSVFRAFPGSVRMVSKSELAKVPIFGQAIKAAGTLIVDRSDTGRAIEALKGASNLIDNGISLWIAPEGTRSQDGRLLPFKKGGFHVALTLGVPILPIFIDGTGIILETKTFSALPGQHVKLRFGPPIKTAGLNTDDLDQLMTDVRNAMLKMAHGIGAAAADELLDA